MPLLYRLARLDLPHEAAVRATIYAAVFPSAYFFGVVYSEALFLLTLVGAALAFRTKRWMLAAVAAAAMTATRVNGVMFLPALALARLARRGIDRRAIARGRSARRPPELVGIGALLVVQLRRSAATRSSGTTASRDGATTPAAIRSSGSVCDRRATGDAADASSSSASGWRRTTRSTR